MINTIGKKPKKISEVNPISVLLFLAYLIRLICDAKVMKLSHERLIKASGKNRHLDPKESTKPCLVPLRITPDRGGPPPLRRTFVEA